MLSNVGEHFNNLIEVHAHQCPLLYNRSGQTVAMHLCIIGKLLAMKHPETGKRDPVGMTNHLLFHVIATCFPKIHHWAKQSVLQLFIQSLQSVTDWEFDEEMCDMCDMDNKLQMGEIEDDW